MSNTYNKGISQRSIGETDYVNDEPIICFDATQEHFIRVLISCFLL